jgi:hypothetical protein
MKVLLHVPGEKPRVLADSTQDDFRPVIRIDTTEWRAGYSVYMEGDAVGSKEAWLGWGVILSTSHVEHDWVILADDTRTRVAFADDACIVSGPSVDNPSQVFVMCDAARETLLSDWSGYGAGPAELFMVTGRCTSPG